jgi:hypothetical protein
MNEFSRQSTERFSRETKFLYAGFARNKFRGTIRAGVALTLKLESAWGGYKREKSRGDILCFFFYGERGASKRLSSACRYVQSGLCVWG